MVVVVVVSGHREVQAAALVTNRLLWSLIVRMEFADLSSDSH